MRKKYKKQGYYSTAPVSQGQFNYGFGMVVPRGPIFYKSCLNLVPTVALLTIFWEILAFFQEEAGPLLQRSERDKFTDAFKILSSLFSELYILSSLFCELIKRKLKK